MAKSSPFGRAGAKRLRGLRLLRLDGLQQSTGGDDLLNERREGLGVEPVSYTHLFALTALPTAAFAQQPEEQAAVQQSLSATDVREMQQADAAVTLSLINI